MARLPTYCVSHPGGPWPYIAELRARLKTLEAALHAIPRELPGEPRAVLVVSSRWQAPLFTLTASARPGLLHDESGFPEQPSRVRYEPPGAPDVALRAQRLLSAAGIPAALDAERGLDEGAFTPLVVLYPSAQVPVLELSLKSGYQTAEHLAAGRALAPLRDEGVLILASCLEDEPAPLAIARGAAEDDAPGLIYREENLPGGGRASIWRFGASYEGTRDAAAMLHEHHERNEKLRHEPHD